MMFKAHKNFYDVLKRALTSMQYRGKVQMLSKGCSENHVVLPNFLIVGAAKCGTTSLYEYLRQHPDVFMPKWKEPVYFMGDPFPPIHKVKKKYLIRLFYAAAGHSARGEASTTYLYDESSPLIIKENLGLVKIIVVLRDPVEMAYSLYNHQVRKEGETLSSFEAALKAEEERITSITFRKHCYGWHANYYYFHRGLYYEQVKRYMDTFGRENVLLFLFEDLVENPVKVAQTTFSFLGIDDAFVPEIKVHNPGGGLWEVPHFWKDAGLFYKTRSYVFSKHFLRKVPHLVRNMGRKPAGPMNPETANRLKQLFHDDICRLEKLIGKDLAAWK